MGTEIFLPMFYLVLLTTVVFLLATFLRLKEIYLDKILNKKGLDGEEFRHPPFETGSITLKNTQRNLSNLLEFPILFYVICIYWIKTKNYYTKFISMPGSAIIAAIGAFWFFERTLLT